MNRISSFKPVVGKNPVILILGSMPGAASLEKREYYGHPQNSFWRIMLGLFRNGRPAPYKTRIGLLKRNGIALWDVLGECRRDGSSADSAIKDGRPNDVAGFLKRHPGIRYIAFNGKTAAEFFKKHHKTGNFSQKIIELPSTSPANAIGHSLKAARWAVLKQLSRRVR